MVVNSSCRQGCFLLTVAVLLAGANQDAKSVEIAHAMIQAMGGEAAWNAAHFVRFDFQVAKDGHSLISRSHLWDKRTGRYRLNDQTKDGAPRVTLMNLATRQGDVFVNGKKLEGPAAGTALTAAYATYINDSYWLMMPWKWLDPGVHLKYLGRQKGLDIVELTFDHVGLTPGDRYRAYVSPQTHRMEHWEYQLQSGDKGSWDWQYAAHNGVTLASNHVNNQGMDINMGQVAILDSAPEACFSNPPQPCPALP